MRQRVGRSIVAMLSVLLATAAQAATQTATTLTSNVNPSAVGTLVTFTASVTGAAPTGNVFFLENGVQVAGCEAVPLEGGGDTRTALCKRSLEVGVHPIVALYPGDANNFGSSSLAIAQEVVNAPPSSLTIVSNPYGPMKVDLQDVTVGTVTHLSPQSIQIFLGDTPGTPGSFVQIDVPELNLGSLHTLRIQSGAPGQTVLLRNLSAKPSAISGALVTVGGSGTTPPPALYVSSPGGFILAPTAAVLSYSGLTLDALGPTGTSGGDIQNAGRVEGTLGLEVLAANVHGSGDFKGNVVRIRTFGHANNPVNGAHFLDNALQIAPSTGQNVDVLLNHFGAAPQVLNVKVKSLTASVLMPSSWDPGSTSPPNNAVVAPGGSRPAGEPEPSYGGGSLIVQATGSLKLANSASNDFVFPGAIVLKAGGTLDVNGVVVNQGWTITGQPFQGVFMESPNIVSPAGNIQVLTNHPNWINFSTRPKQAVRTWSLAPDAGGGASYIVADAFAPHLNTFSTVVEAAANGQCWTCLINPVPVDMTGAPPP